MFIPLLNLYMHTLKYPKQLLKMYTGFSLLLHVLSNVSLLKIDCQAYKLMDIVYVRTKITNVIMF